jgi:hypothetical protein
VSAVNVVVLAVNAPLIGIAPRDRATPRVLHAITMEAIVQGWPKEPGRRKIRFAAACGRAGCALYPPPDDLYDIVPWPPLVKGLAPVFARCAECHRVTGGKRPRSTVRSS